jgi:hypothetical protein
MDLGIIIAIVGSMLAIVGVMISLMLWVRSEANADRRDMANLVIAIKDEIKDFHDRLIRIEERRSK